MNEELIISISDSIFNYIENRENVSFDEVIKSIGKSIIDKNNLHEYVNDINIKEVYDHNHDSKGMLDNDNNICIFRQGIEKRLSEVLETVPGFSENEVELCRCLLYTKTLLHELEHVKQKKLLKEDPENNSLETLITRLAEDTKGDSVVYYQCLYNFFPTERLAEIQALRTITKVTEHLETKCDMELLSCYINRRALYEEFAHYYEYGLSGPTTQYFDFRDSDSLTVLKAEREKKELSLEDRVLYGFEISWSEYEGMVLHYGTFYEKTEELSQKRKK